MLRKYYIIINWLSTTKRKQMVTAWQQHKKRLTNVVIWCRVLEIIINHERERSMREFSVATANLIVIELIIVIRQ